MRVKVQCPVLNREVIVDVEVLTIEDLNGNKDVIIGRVTC